ncbi:MAG: hypothetical protein PF489_04620 [Salinivirgaceae bacterium]|jgi:hypothetical protein|nr:hypothetical protein [Salinivirgaceae bacterium]
MQTKHMIIIGTLSILFAAACSNEKVTVTDFKITDCESNSTDTLHIPMDLSSAITEGIVIPGKMTESGYFTFSFNIENKGNTDQSFYYKIYYQNESYKFPEALEEGQYNPKSAENFYGSWIHCKQNFKATAKIAPSTKKTIIDSIQIAGNPRNEKIYFGEETRNRTVDADHINQIIRSIKNSKEWLAGVKEKAKRNNVPLAEQLYMDAKWTVEHQQRQGNVNTRWKRNPRVGTYSFLLVVTPKEKLHQIPEHIRNIQQKDTATRQFINPYYYFLHAKNTPKGILVKQTPHAIRVHAQMDLTKGIYIDPLDLSYEPDLKNTSSTVGFSDQLFENAHWAQFYHNINKNYALNNIPIAYDVTGNNYTREQYNKNTAKYNDSNRKQDFVKVSAKPGNTVGYNKEEKAICIKNEGTANSGKLKKENVGVQTRIGLTYGTFTAKIQFPEIISTDFVWNGLTCAFWLLYQEAEWNQRDACKTGYIPKHISGKNEGDYVKTTNYSEIDIEIVKAAANWPKSSYGKNKKYVKDNALNENVIIASTNWDMACQDVENFTIGAKPLSYKDHNFTIHRWDHWYKALTSKHESKQTDALGKPIYYQIEWKPNEIIWRMGENKNNMSVIGYMNNKNTKIPNNQMITVITQEFHDGSWWPTAPFNQDNVPFPKSDIKGYVYELTIE